jgi:hypothetical protein
VDDAKQNVHLVIHEILHLPATEISPGTDPRLADLKQLSTSQIDSLQADSRYTAVENALRDATQMLARVRQKLLDADADWAAAHRDLVHAHQKTRSGEKQRRVVGTAAAGKRKDLQNISNVATSTQDVIAFGQFRLRQLGVSTRYQNSRYPARTR